MTSHVLAMGDIGAGETLQVGDEAMLEAAMAEIGSRIDVRWTLVSSHPGESSARYGVSSIGRFGFEELAHPADRDARLEQIASAARWEAHLPVDDPALALIDAVAAADAVLITGGGNLAPAWPAQIYERAALALIAAARHKPLVVSGQGLGPQLSRREGELIGRLLTEAQLVGVREGRSTALARRLGVPPQSTWCTVDDAWTLAGREPAIAPTAPFVAVTLSDVFGVELAEDLLAPWGQLLDDLVATTGLDVLLIPHVGSTSGRASDDVALHDELVARTKSGRVRAAPLLEAAKVGWLTRRASLVVTSRYHPVAFALSASVPVVAIAVDDYTENKLRGALELVGLGGWCVSMFGLRAGFLATAVEEAWSRRADVIEHLESRVELLSAAKADYWDAVAVVVAGGSAPTRAAELGDLDLPEKGVPLGDWTVRNADALSWSRLFSEQRGDLVRAVDLAESDRAAALQELEAQHHARRHAVDEVIALQEALAIERAASEAARWKNAEVLQLSRSRLRERDQKLAAQASELQAAQRDAAEYARLRNTKLLRWSGPARKAYSSLRKR